MKMLKGKIKITLNDAAGLSLRTSPIDFLQYANNFKLLNIENNMVATYVWHPLGADWKASIQNIFISDIMTALNKNYISDSLEYDQIEHALSYTNYLKTILPVRLNEVILKFLSQDYDVNVEIHV